MRLFRREHRHAFTYKHVFSGPANTVTVRACECGFEERELTQAGAQQVGWWVLLGLSHEDAVDGVRMGTLPYPLEADGKGWVLRDPRPGGRSRIVLSRTIGGDAK